VSLFSKTAQTDDDALDTSDFQRKPLGALLFLGPTGSGKTRSVEAAAEALFGDPHAMLKIDCAEF